MFAFSDGGPTEKASTDLEDIYETVVHDESTITVVEDWKEYKMSHESSKVDSLEEGVEDSGGQNEEDREISVDEERAHDQDTSVEGKKQRILDALEEGFRGLISVEHMEDLVSLHSRTRVIVSVDKLVELLGPKCFEEQSGLVCQGTISHTAKACGSSVDITWRCSKGHHGKWESSEVLMTNCYSKVFGNDSLLAIAIVLSDNNYAKFLLVAKRHQHNQFYEFPEELCCASCETCRERCIKQSLIF